MRNPIPTTCLVANHSFYRTLTTFILLLLSFTAGNAQSVWTWVSGDNTANQTGQLCWYWNKVPY